MTQSVRVQNFTVSRDGFGAGEGQSLERPFGHADPGAPVAWAGATASWPNRTEPGGTRGLDDYFTRDFANNIGAEIMGRNKFGPQRGPWEDHDWKGWWGDEPPFHTPVFVLTHHARPSFTLADTTFHFLDATPAEALRQAKDAADGKDVRIGGGVATVREFLDADLIDTMHVAVAPVELGRGERLWTSPEDLLDRFHLERSRARAGWCTTSSGGAEPGERPARRRPRCGVTRSGSQRAGGGSVVRAECSKACADQAMRSPASARDSPAMSVSQTSASIPMVARIARTSRCTSAADSSPCSGASASAIQPIARP